MFTFEGWSYGLVFLPLVVLGLTLVNLITWPRGRANPFAGLRISVLIPARNEAANIRKCIEAVLRSRHAVHEVIVYDDASTDDTPAILKQLAHETSVLRVVNGQGLPDGWVGKPHACHRLAQAATGDVLLFLDADVRLFPEGIERIIDLAENLQADLVTAVPRQVTYGFWEKLILPLLHLTYTSWFPLVLTYRSRDPRFLAANGQLLAVRRAAYDALGGFEAVKAEVVDDMALCRRAKQHGRRVVFADGHRMAACRMYGSLSEIWAGFSKNIYAGIGARWYALALVLGMYIGAFLVPYGLLIAGLLGVSEAWVPGMIGVGANLVVRVLLAGRFRQSWWSTLLHPVGILAFIAIALNSFRWYVAGRVQWRGRSYGGQKRNLDDINAVKAEASS